MRACPSCGAANTPTQKFCGECGTALPATPTLGEARVPESYTPRHLAEKILASRTAIEGERKPVTVLFCDVVSSTVLAETLGPEGMHALLNGFFETALAEVHRYEGTINQFLGDGFMALFGAPLAHEDHARRAVLAALAITRAVAERPLEAEPGRPVPLKLRLGLHTGFVVVGAIGDNLRMDYTAVGDTTHLAARLQQLAEPGAIVVSDATARLVRGYASLEALGPVQVRGRSTPVEIYHVTGPGTRRSALEATGERPLSAFVGRERELRLLENLLAEVEAGRGQAVGVVGEPGVGKSRVLLELRRTLSARDTGYLEGRCLSFGSAIPYAPVLDLVRTQCGLSDPDTPEVIAAKVRAELAKLGMDGANLAPYLLHLLGLKEEADVLGGLSPEAIKVRTFGMLRQMHLRDSRRRPLVVVIEDLHWIDRTSDEYLAFLVESLAGAPVLLLATYRPGYRPTWMDKSYATQLSLARLTARDSLSVVRSVLPQVTPEEALTRLILDKAEGNPFFLEELARAVGDGGGATAELAVPDTVHGVLTARIDRLAETPKRVLQTASILGREFPRRLLEALWDGRALDEHLHELTRQEFLYERSGGDEVAYVFKHALTQDVAEATILAPRRRELHRRAADALAALDPERVRELAPLLAHHYNRAEAWSLACDYATRAAEAASAACANREALERYDQAITASTRAAIPPAGRARLHAARAHVHGVLGAFEPARADLEMALELAATADDAAMRASLLGALGMLWGGHQDYQRGLALTEEAMHVAELAGDHAALGEALVKTGLMQLNVARLGDSQRTLERALTIFRDLDDRRGRAQTLDVLSMVAGIGGRLAESGAHNDEALALFRALGDRMPQASLITNRGFWLAYGGERVRGEPLIRAGLATAVALGARSDEAYAHLALADTAGMYGAYGESFRECHAGLAIARPIGHREWTANGMAILGRLHRECGDARGAIAIHEEMLEIARALSGIWVAEALGNLGRDWLALDEEARAAALLTEAIDASPEAFKFKLPAILGMIELRLRQNDAAGALAIAGEFLGVGRAFLVMAADVRRLEGEALLALGQPEAAETAVREAQAQACALGAESVGWLASLSLADILGARARTDAASQERAAARTMLDGVAADLPEDLRAGFVNSPVMRRALRDHDAQGGRH